MKTDTKTRPWIFRAGAGFLALTSSALVLVMTRQGVGVFGDNLAYFRVAESLNVLSLRAHPPLYPLVLGMFMRLLHITPEQAAVGVNLIAFPLIVLAIMYGMRGLKPRTFVPPYLAGLALLITYPMLEIHAHAFSEPLFLLSVSGALLAFARIRSAGVSPRRLMIAVVCSALAVLTRYAGAALILYGCLIMLSVAGAPVVRMLRCVVFGMLSSLPLALFLLMRKWLDPTVDNVTGRAIELSRVGENAAHVAAYQIPQTLLTLVEWFAPYRLIVFLGLYTGVLLVGGAVVLVLIWGYRRSGEVRSVWILYGGWPVVYGLFLLGWITMSGETEVVIRHRILSPAACWVVPLFVFSLATAMEEKRGIRVTGAVFLGLFLSFSAVRAATYVHRIQREGVGVTSLAWRTSETVQYVRFKMPDVPLYTNAPDILRLLGVERDIRGFPRKRDQRSMRPLEENRVQHSIDSMRRAMEEEGALMAVFRRAHPTDDDFPPYMMTPGELLEILDPVIIYEADDGVVYGCGEES